MVVRVVTRHRQNLVVGLSAIQHLEHAHRAAVDLAAGKRWLGNVHENVERIAILVQGARNESVVSWIMHRRVEHAIESNHAARLVQLVFVSAAGRNLDYRGDVVRRMNPRRQLVPEIDHAVARCIVPL